MHWTSWSPLSGGDAARRRREANPYLLTSKSAQEPEYPEQPRLWLGALPFAPIGNGDFLAFDLSQPCGGPPVVYLAHDDESVGLAPSFEALLLAWERPCYLGPEIWLLGEFRSAESGFLDPESARAEQLRRLFDLT